MALSPLAASGSETGDFLGPASGWGSVAIVAHQVSPIGGAEEMYLSGAGTVEIIEVRLDPVVVARQREFTFTGLAAQVTDLIQKLVAGDVLDADLDGGPPPSDIPSLVLILRNGSGQVRSVPFPRDGPTQAYEDAWLALSELSRITAGQTPAVERTYDPAYIPAAFSWAAAILLPRKAVSFVEIPTAEEAEAAGRRYQRLIDEVKRQEEGRHRDRHDEDDKNHKDDKEGKEDKDDKKGGGDRGGGHDDDA